MSQSNNPLDKAFDEFEQVCSDGRVIRKEMIAALQKQVAKVEINPEYDKAMTIQSKLMMYKTLDDLIKSDEDISMKKLRMKLTRKEGEQNGMVGAAVVGLLKEIRAMGGANAIARPQEKTQADIQKELENAAKEQKIEVSQGELEACSAAADTTSRNKPEVKSED